MRCAPTGFTAIVLPQEEPCLEINTPPPPQFVAPDGTVNLLNAFECEWASVYLMTKVYSKKARKAALWLGSDDG